MFPLIIFLGLLSQPVLADSASTVQPFLLQPDGVGYLGWLTPEQCHNDRRCDIVIVDPSSGFLYVEQSDDWFGRRIYTSNSWSLSQRISYEVKEGLVQQVEDAWGVEVNYLYDGRNIVEIQWSDGRTLQMSYDRKGRVISMTDGGDHLLSFFWGKDHHRMVDSQGHVVEWWLEKGRITTRNSLGIESSLLVEESEVIGWIDPRGVETRLIPDENGFQIDQGGLRTWQVEHHQSKPSQITLTGSGTWRWVRDDEGQLKEVIDPTGNSVKILRNNPLVWRFLRSNGFIDLHFSQEEDLEEIKDVSGRLLSIQRDIFGRIIRIEDAVGEGFTIKRDSTGDINKVLMRDGAEWNLEWDGRGRLRGVVTPTQNVWGFQRDSWGAITKIERSHRSTIDIRRDQFRRWTRITQDETNISARRDVYGRLLELNMNDSVSFSIQRDVLGQITKLTLDGEVWNIKRDTFGNIVKWNDVSIKRGSWDGIVQHSIDDQVWAWGRDAQGRLKNIVAEEQLEIQYDGLGNPVEWSLGDEVNKIQRNHWGWITAYDDAWVDRDPRGLVTKVGVLDQEWRFNRDASGRILVVKAPYDLQIGLRRISGGEVEQCRLPSGALQHFEWQANLFNQSYTNQEGQRHPIGSSSSQTEWSFPNTELAHNSLSSASYVGVHTIQHFENVDIIDYDAFHFVQQVCDLSSCFHFDYDARGRIRSVDDGSGLPINIVWGWSGWGEAPLLIGGTLGIHSQLGMLVQTNGNQHQEYPIWKDQPISLGWNPDDEFADSARWVDDRLYLSGVTTSWSGQKAYLNSIDSALQKEYPWQSNTLDASLYSGVAETSFWNNPLEVLWSIGILESFDWLSPNIESPLPWVDKGWVEDGKFVNMTVSSLPIQEPPLEELLIASLLAGQPDPSISEVLGVILGEEDVAFLVNQQSLLSVLK